RPIKVDVRIISATNRDLVEEVANGTFREDLYYRLNVFPVHVPALRDRADDIPALIEHFIQRYNAEEKRNVRGVKHEVLEILKGQAWPGNIRQLENTIFRAVVLAEGAYLSASDFPLLAAEFEACGFEDGPPQLVDDEVDPYHDEHNDALKQTINANGLSPVEPQDGSTAPGSMIDLSVFDTDGHLRTLKDIERDLITLAIDTYNGQMSEVARRLGMGRSTLYRKLRDHEIEVQRAS
ncbi:MAG: helix-turn-helix domain-containing protein, partial [Pseudomonadota bacterium]